MLFSKRKKSYHSLLLAVPAVVLMCFAMSSAQTIYQGTASGMVIMEAEKTASPLDKWIKVTAPANYAGTGGLEFTGNSPSGGSAVSPLTYKFKIATAGIHKIKLRAHKRLAGAPGDQCNDCYIRVEGDYTSGSNLPLSGLTQNNKCYIHGQSATTWDYSGDLDGLGWDHTQALYNFKAGQTYTMTVSGRSQRYNLDRIVFFLPAAETAALNYLTPETTGGTVTPTCTDGIQNGDETGIDCGGSCPNACGTPACTQTYTYGATTNFTALAATGEFVPYYKDGNRLAIAATNTSYRNKWAAAELTFDGVDCTYDFKLTGLCETDGETSYKMYVNGVQIGTAMKNQRIQGTAIPDYTPQVHIVKGVTIKKGDKIRVESDCNSNGLVPEGSGFAWARGRWTQLQLVPGAVAVIHGSSVKAAPASLRFANGNLTFTPPSGGKYTITLHSLSGKIVSTRSIMASAKVPATISLAGSAKGTFIARASGTGYSTGLLVVMQ